MNTISFITLSNSGYIPLTLNCIESLKKINCEYPLQCYCIDNNCYEILKQKYNNKYVDMVPNLKYKYNNIPEFRKENWNKVVINKFNIIYENLNRTDYVLFTDGDIVYEKNGFIEYCIEKIKEKNVDFLIQNDGNSDNQTNNLCSGFMFIKSNEKTKHFFNPKNIDINNFECDQIYINKNYKKFNINIEPLSINLFPNGGYYRRNSNLNNNFLIHFNWCGGERKIQWMKNCNKYYV